MAEWRWLTIGLLLLAAALTAACRLAAKSSETTAATAGTGNDGYNVVAGKDYSDREPLYGGDPLSWPTPAGDAADSNYCAASLRLPLQREPVWEYMYTPAQFSAGDPTQMTHYDGTLAVISACPQVLALNVDTGELVFNQDVFSHQDIDRAPEQFTGLYVSPLGLMVAKDNLGRQYCWDMREGTLDRLWLGPPTTGIGGYVALSDSLITSLDNEIRTQAIDTGEEIWRYPNLGPRCGVVVSADGVVVAWTSVGEFYALDADSGALLWTYLSGITGWLAGVRAAIDDSQGCVYLLLADESAQRRNLANGELEWEYSWEDMTSAAQREEMFNGSQSGPFPMYAIAPVVTPDGLVFSTISGFTIALDHAGQQRWVYQTNVAMWGSVGFNNGIFVVERFITPGHRQYLSPLKVFCPETIDWENYRTADERGQSEDVFERLVVLDNATGELLDTFESILPTRAALPAHDLFVIGETAPFGVREHYIKGYRWLEWQREGTE